MVSPETVIGWSVVGLKRLANLTLLHQRLGNSATAHKGITRELQRVSIRDPSRSGMARRAVTSQRHPGARSKHYPRLLSCAFVSVVVEDFRFLTNPRSQQAALTSPFCVES